MMIKLTSACSMGCKHCINDAKPDGQHMSMEVLKDTMNFIKNMNKELSVLITGGEPTENPEFFNMCKYIMDFTLENDLKITYLVTTNGFWILDHPEETKEILSWGDDIRKIQFQVSADVRYYPKRLPFHKRIFREKGIMVVDDCVQHIYPQGRAVENNLPVSKAFNVPKCANSKIIVIQQTMRGQQPSFINLVSALNKAGKFCTPHIRPNGDIALGESCLCPAVSSIYKSDIDIGLDIIQFNCFKCREHLYKPEQEDRAFTFRMV